MKLKNLIQITQPCENQLGIKEKLSPISKVLKCGCIGAKRSYLVRRLTLLMDNYLNAFWDTYREEFKARAVEKDGEFIILDKPTHNEFWQIIDDLAEQPLDLNYPKVHLKLTDEMNISSDELALLEPFFDFEIEE